MLQIFLQYFRKIQTKLTRQTLLRTLVLLISLSIVSSFTILYFEKDAGSGFRTFGDGLWWFIVTSTTVGYGDLYPKTPDGRIIGTIVMLFGIGTVGFVLANITSSLVERKLRKSMGLVNATLRNHIVICGWTQATRDVVTELAAGSKEIVVVANLEQSPDKRVEYVRGDATDDAILEAAGIKQAKACIIIGEQNDPQSDARAILITLSVRALNPDICVIAQVFDTQNAVHLSRAGADEIVRTQELGNKMMVRAALQRGVSKVFSELITNQYGQEVYLIKNVLFDQAVAFSEAIARYKEEYNILVIGIDEGATVKINPMGTFEVKPTDTLVVLAEDETSLPR